MGSCFENSGINTSETLNNPNFKPRQSVGDILEWFTEHGPSIEIRDAATRAKRIWQTWKNKHDQQQEQMELPVHQGE